MLKLKTTLLTFLSLTLLTASILPGHAQNVTVQDTKHLSKKTYSGNPILWREPAHQGLNE